jgi:hypothetical protein
MASEGLSANHPYMIAWNKFCETDEFKSALHWAIRTKYDDESLIDPIQQEQHVKGLMWLVFTKGMEITNG